MQNTNDKLSWLQIKKGTQALSLPRVNGFPSDALALQEAGNRRLGVSGLGHLTNHPVRAMLILGKLFLFALLRPRWGSFDKHAVTARAHTGNEMGHQQVPL